MGTANTDKVFAGSIPKFYEDYLVPLIFEPYATDLVNRLRTRTLSRVLEIAAGTGVVTRALASALPESTSIVATDLNQAMLDQASAVGTKRYVQWRQADAMQLPFQDAMFDAVVCQFGVMFFPEKSKAFAEAHRVLKPGGILIFNVWDRIEETNSRTRSRTRWHRCSRTIRRAFSHAHRMAITTPARSHATSQMVDSPARLALTRLRHAAGRSLQRIRRPRTARAHR